MSAGNRPATPIAPRIEAEASPSPRLEAVPEIAAALPADPTRRRLASLPVLVLAGVSVLLLGFSAIGTVEFVLAQFDRAPWLGWLTAAIAIAGFALILAGLWRELAGLARLRAVDRLRRDLASGDARRQVRAARIWLRLLPDGEAVRPALDAINDPDAILPLLRAGPAATLRARTDALARTASVQVLAGVGAMPTAGLAALFFAWRGVRLIRQVAVLHGLRPGLFATLGLMQRTALSATTVAGAEIAVNAVLHGVLSNPLLAHVAGDVAGAGVAARRMVVLARAAAAACSPIREER